MKKIMTILLSVIMIITLASCTEKETEKINILCSNTFKESSRLNELIKEYTKEDTESVVINYVEDNEISNSINEDIDIVITDNKEIAESVQSKEKHEILKQEYMLLSPMEQNIEANEDPKVILKQIAEGQFKFASPEDSTNAYAIEKNLWEKLEIVPQGEWYISTGKDEVENAIMASDMQAYAIVSEYVYEQNKDKIFLEIMTKGGEDLTTTSSILLLSDKESAKEFTDFIVSSSSS